MMTNDELRVFLTAIASHFGWPLHYWLAFGRVWASYEGTDARYNPLATTQPMPGSTAFNSAGVQDYASIDDGIQATIWSLDPTAYNGVDYYPSVRRAVANASIDDAGRRSAIAAEIGTWGTSGFAAIIRDGWNPDVENIIRTAGWGDILDKPTSEAPAEPPIENAPMGETLESRLAEMERYNRALNAAVLYRFELVRMGRLDDAADPNTPIPGV